MISGKVVSFDGQFAFPEALEFGEFKNVCLAPPEYKLTDPVEGGIAQPEQYPDYVRHHRHNRIADVSSSYEGNRKRLGGAYIYGGFILHHFGHFIAEALGRLWIKDRAEYIDLPVVFMLASENTSMIPTVMEVLKIFGITNVVFETDHIEVEQLIIAEAGKHMGGCFHPNYLNWLGNYTGAAFWEDESFPMKIAVLRGHFPAGKVAGEGALEAVLAENGYFILHPEKHSIKDQLKYYGNAEKIIFSEGSAIHMCDLLPSLKADVFVLNRRPASRLAYTSLVQKAPNLTILNDVSRVLTPRREGGKGFNRALSYIDFLTIEKQLLNTGFVEAGGFKAGWSKNLAVGAAMEFLNQPQDMDQTPESIDALIKLLYGEVDDYFKLLYKKRCTHHIERFFHAMVLGKYDAALKNAQRLDRLVPYSDQVQQFEQQALAGKKRVATIIGRYGDALVRAYNVLRDKSRFYPLPEYEFDKIVHFKNGVKM